MRTIIAGSRGLGYVQVCKATENCGWVPTAVLSGCAVGADRAGELWAMAQGIPIEYHPAEWDKHGKQAGILRNIDMADCAEALVAVWDGKSRGTKHMIETAKKKGLRVYVEVESD